MKCVGTMLGSRPLTWSVLKHTMYDIKGTRYMCTPVSLYTKTGLWPAQLKRETMLQIEEVWKKRVQAHNTTRSDSVKKTDQKKFYVLSMFPYPSGKLHMGHVRVYTISDMMARYHRMLGHDVIHPMGWDAFGLPAENAAIERKLHPKQWTYSNIDTMKQQLNNLCCSFDWDKEITTCDPSYYKWTQYIFLQMYHAGLVYQKEASVNWDPVDETVLADEQIDDEGCSWRSGAKVEKRYLRQWYIRTTAYAKSLWDGLDTVRSDLWKDVIQMQKNWIGQCTGCRLDFKLMLGGEEFGDILSVFTESPESVCGISHIGLATHHRYNQSKYYKQMDQLTSSPGENDIMLTLEAVNPVTGACIPIIVSKTSEAAMINNDAHLGVPCMSDIDREAADGLEIPWQPVFTDSCGNETLINSPSYNGLSRFEAAEAVMEYARQNGVGGHPVSSYLKDWLISRQRYWGTPIPMMHCDKCKAVPVAYEDLPVVLPDTVGTFNGKGQSALLENEEWLQVKCSKCGGPARRETDTMDTFVDSSWYFLRYLDTNNQSLPVTKSHADNYMPVDLYIGGKEHAYLHLYYARFFNHFLCDLGLTEHREPFVNLLTQGMVKGESYKLKRTGVYIHSSEVDKVDGKYKQKGTDESVTVKYEKMSKSKLNGVDPEELFEIYGVDMTRLCILSNVAPKSERNWNNEVYVGVQKWLNRVWSLVGVLVNRSEVTKTAEDKLVDQWNSTIKTFRNQYLMEIGKHMEKTFLFNAAISRMHELTSELKKVPLEVAVSSSEYERAVSDLVVIMAPLSPMFSSELWAVLANQINSSWTKYDLTRGVHEQQWPTVDSDLEVILSVCCNNEVIGRIPVLYQELQNLTSESALLKTRGEEFFTEFKESLLNQTMPEPTLKLNETSARLNFNVPSLKKKNKKETKKKKTKVNN